MGAEPPGSYHGHPLTLPELRTALAMTGDKENAFVRAKELLRTERRLTEAECEELQGLFDDVTGTQFMALTQDPQHQLALRQYDRHTWRPAKPILITMIVLLVLSVAMGLFVSLRQ